MFTARYGLSSYTIQASLSACRPLRESDNKLFGHLLSLFEFKIPNFSPLPSLPQGNWLRDLKCVTLYCRVLVATNGDQSSASHRGGPGSIPGQFMRYLSWTKWHWQRGSPLPPVLLFSPALLFRQCPIMLFIYTLFLAEGRTREDWEPFKSSYLTEIRKH